MSAAGAPSDRFSPAALRASPNPLAAHYRHFRVGERLLLTGHSHQAWPDVAREGQLAAWDDAATHVDDKWERALAAADAVRAGFATRLGDGAGSYALAANTHDLLLRFLSAQPLRQRPAILTTDGEFHSARRQLARLSEEGVRVERLPATPADDIGERLARRVDDGVAAVVVSAVFYQDARIAGGLRELAAACRHHGAALLVDAYHAVNVVPFDLTGLEDAWVVGGGYKYCQLGEGNCFLRVPPGGERLRPTITGWYAEFERLEAAVGGEVSYPSTGAGRFAGSTYDPTSHYRARRVFEFFAEMGLDVPLLRAVSQHQVGLLAAEVDGLDLPPAALARDRAAPLARLGGFLALRSPRAGELQAALAARGVLTDQRGDVLRLGPAPYLSDEQLRQAVGILGEVVREVVA